ncbi:MAG: ACP S-malonyltransferase [Nanoarchaeota archaeon]|nr:ACP S-malonyltransferase [Nanoarchaeota archaeon]
MKNPPIKACYVFPGQGSQSVGMGKYIYNKYESAREIFDTGNKILKPDLKFNITDLMFGGPEELLMETKYCQSSIFLNNVAHYFVLNEKIDCVLTLGHSIGEYSALVASGALSLEDGIKLVNIRAKLMSECIPKKTIKRDISHHMAAVLTDNLDLTYKKTIDSINEACEVGSSDGGRVQIANINSSSQIIISGNENAVIRAVEYLKNKGIKKIVYLKVEGPFHSELMRPAAEGMEKALENIEINELKIPYISNSTGNLIFEPNKIKESLVEQIYKTVEWKKSLETAIQNGFTTFVESGSGEKQYNLLNRNYKNINVLDVKNYIN